MPHDPSEFPGPATPPRHRGDSSDQRTVWATVVPFLGARLLANLYLRFPYVFLTAISRGLGVPIQTVTMVLGLRELSGVASPVVGRAVDRGHLRTTLMGSGLVMGAACAAAGIGGIWWFGATMVVGGLAKFSLDIAQNSWIGHNVAMSRRARVVGVVEMSWSGAFLAGIPLLAWVIDRFGWRAAFGVTGPAIALMAIVAGYRVEDQPPDGPVEREANATDNHAPSTPRVIRLATTRPPPARWAVMMYVFAQPMAQMLVFAVNGDWFAQTLGLSTTEVGLASVALGVAELIGTVMTIVLTDRLGPSRVGVAALMAVIPAMIALSLVGTHAIFGIAILFAMDIALEFSFVSVLPLVTELDPANRATAIGRAMVVITVSRALGSAIAGWIYVAGGIAATGACGAIAAATGTAALFAGTKGTRASEALR